MMGLFPTNMHIFVTCDDNDCTMHNVKVDTQAVNGKKITITQPSCRMPDSVLCLSYMTPAEKNELWLSAN